MKRLTILTLGLLLIAGQVSADISTGLVGYWPLNRNWMQDANTFSDLSTSGNNGTRVNAVAGEESTAFDGAGDWVTFTNSGLNAVGATSITVAVWVYTDPAVWDGTVDSIIDNTLGGNLANDGLIVLLDDRGGGDVTEGIFADVATATGNYIRINSNDNTISSIGWYHIAFTYTASTGKVYINGSDETFSDGSGTGNFTPNALSMYFGSSSTEGTNFTGNLSDVRIYSRALSSGDVAELYALGQPEMPVATLRGVTLEGVTIN